MNIPDVAGGHLYKWVTVLGTFVLMSSIYGMAVTFDSSDSRLREIVAKTVFARDTGEVERSYWSEYLSIQKRNTQVVLSLLVITAVIGVAVALAGVCFWYRRVQRFEDEKHQLENLKLKQIVDEKTDAKRLVT